MPKVTGTFLRADGTPCGGSVAFAPSVAIGDMDEVRLPAPCEVHLDAAGAFEVTLPATDDPAYTPAGWVWEVRERIAGGRDAWHFELTADTDYWDLITVTPPDDYAPWVVSATATTGAPGTDADADVTRTANELDFTFTIPRGDPGPTTELSVGTVTTGAPGSSAAAAITGTPPTLELDLTIPRGDVGATGPANSLAVGTVTTGAAGSSASATITGTPPLQTLELTIPRGDTGATGMPSSLYDAKGDLITASANDTPVRLAVGIAGTNPILTPDTSAAGGLAWKSFIDAGVARAGVTTSSINVTWSAATPVLTVSAAVTVTLPAAASNTGSLATIINIGTGSVAIARTGSDLIAGSLTSTSIPAAGSLRLVSDGTGWRVIDGRYTSSAVGLATYEWNHSAPGWRLIAYDSGVRNVTANIVNGWTAAGIRVRRTKSTLFIALDALNAAGASSALFLNFSSGFSISQAAIVDVGVVWNSTAAAPASIAHNGIGWYRTGHSAVTTSLSGSIATVTSDSLPTSLPGTQITAPV